jgi:hypothetical protein
MTFSYDGQEAMDVLLPPAIEDSLFTVVPERVAVDVNPGRPWHSNRAWQVASFSLLA